MTPKHPPGPPMTLGNMRVLSIRAQDSIQSSPAALSVLAAPWWKRRALSDLDSLPGGPAIYCINDDAALEPEPAYIGESSRLRDRAISHAAGPLADV